MISARKSRVLETMRKGKKALCCKSNLSCPRCIVKTAHKYGKFAGTVSVPSMKICYEEGFDFINCGADVLAIGENCKSIRKMYCETVGISN